MLRVKSKKNKLIVVVSPGRSGQSSFSLILKQAFPSALVAFEEPQINYFLPKPLASFERKFRRKFVETDELLGRGRVLRAFESQDFEQLNSFGEDKYKWLLKKMHKRNTNVVFEVNKHFLHGLHLGVQNLLNVEFKMIALVRDPIANMRSFLNRNKNFYLDNSPPDCPYNELVLDRNILSKGQLYLHAWCECYLRARKFCKVNKLELLTARTADLENPKEVMRILKRLDMPICKIENFDKLNTNRSLGNQDTVVSDFDVREAKMFWQLLPSKVVSKLPNIESLIKKSR